MPRLIIAILTLLAWSPLASVRSLGAPARGEACATHVCHVQVVERACCGEPVAPPACPMSGGDCDCGMAPAPAPARVPDAPLPRGDGDRVVAPGPTAVELVEAALGASSAPTPAWAGFGVHARLSHNAVRAYLSVWRT